MKETKIYFSFENKEQLNKIIIFVSSLFEGFSIYKTLGYWKGLKESSRIIEIISENSYYNIESILFKQISIYIKQIANQESVLITTKEINSELI